MSRGRSPTAVIRLHHIFEWERVNAAIAARTGIWVYMVVLVATHDGMTDPVKLGVACLSLVAIIVPAVTWWAAYWLTVTLLLAADLTYSYSHAANHYYLTIYTLAILSLETHRRTRGEQLAFNLPRVLLMVVFGLAAAQKAISPYFLSGRLMADYVLTGGSLYWPLVWIYPGHGGGVEAFEQQFGLISSDPGLVGTQVPIELPFAGFSILVQGAAVAILLFELGVFVALAWNRAFRHAVMPALMLLFLWGTFLLRPEFSFFALLAILFMLARPGLSLRWTALFVISIVVFLSLEVSEMAGVF
jgi:hypothetical protein